MRTPAEPISAYLRTCLIREEAICSSRLRSREFILHAPLFSSLLRRVRLSCSVLLDEKFQPLRNERTCTSRKEISISLPRHLFNATAFNAVLEFFLKEHPTTLRFSNENAQGEKVQRKWRMFFCNFHQQTTKTDWVGCLKLLRPRASRQQLAYANTSTGG